MFQKSAVPATSAIKGLTSTSVVTAVQLKSSQMDTLAAIMSGSVTCFNTVHGLFVFLFATGLSCLPTDLFRCPRCTGHCVQQLQGHVLAQVKFTIDCTMQLQHEG
jgi:hypothetical protein